MGTLCAARGRWSVAGETDAPVAHGVLADIAARPALSPMELLEQRVPTGGLLVVTGTRVRRSPAVDLAGHRDVVHVGPLAGWPRGLGEAVQETLAGRQPPAVLVLDAPDLLGAGGEAVDGLAVRGALHRLRARYPATRVVAYVGPTSFALRHALPGTVVVTLPDDPAGDAAAEPAEVRARVDDCLARVGEGNLARVIGGLAVLAAHPGYDVFCPPPALVAAVPAAELTAAFTAALRAAWPAPDSPAAHPAEPGELALPRLAATVYRILSLSRATAAARTFRGVDLGRWLCALRAHRYETLAAVAASLAGEDLCGRNLFHAPPLEYGDLRGVDLSESDAYRVNLANADLSGARLVRACLSRAHLKQALLRDADLTGADVSYASLEQADLTGAVLSGANLDRCRVDHAVGLPP